jgi:hypothetical protein
MNNIAKLHLNELKEIFAESSAKIGIAPAIIEKDFWVTWVLGQIYSNKALSSLLMFKGGTSLSKVFGAIERFSEDIDLILNWHSLTDENPKELRSKNKQYKFNEDIQQKAIDYIATSLLPQFKELLSPLCNCTIDTDNQYAINVNYPTVFSDPYLRPQILLEIGPLAEWLPYNSYQICSIVAEIFPNLFTQTHCTVNAIVAERTFWEKATILHHEANRPSNSSLPSRYSRHYYDLSRLSLSQIKDNALKQIDLLNQVVQFKQRFYPRTWAKYDEINKDGLKLVPPEFRIKLLQEDYEQMRSMIFGAYPKFEEIIKTLQKLEDEINSKIMEYKN